MMDQVTNLLEQYNIPVSIMSQIQEKLSNGFQISDVISIINDNKDSIQNSPELLSKLEGMGGVAGIVGGFKEGGISSALDQAKGMFGL
jgi:hypothetical protein